LIYYASKLWPLPFFLLAFYYTGLFNRDIIFIMLIVVFVTGITLLSVMGARSNIEKQAEKIADHPDNSSLFLPGVISFSESGIHLKNDLIESKFQWKAFIKKLESENYYFLFISNIQALIIPKRLLPNNESKIQLEKILNQYLSMDAELGHFVRS
jgi:hypothetical protein